MEKPVILCVDDEKVVLISLKAQLKRHFGNEYTIETAESGEEAIEIIEELFEDNLDLPLVISDQIMPGMKGNEFLKEVHRRSCKTLKILLTGQADANAVGQAVNDAKLYRYIAKPWEETDLNLTATEAIRSYFQDKKLEEQNKELATLVQKLQDYNEKLEEKVEERTQKITAQKEIIEDKNRDITASINYAKRIQVAMLPQIDLMKNTFADFTVLFKPRDIVSGDFYWFAEKDNKQIIAAVDCTGHGVPGAFMSMIGNDLLNEIVEARGITEANVILDKLHLGVLKALKQDENDNRDGMDVALCVIDNNAKTMDFAGAKNPIVYIQNDELKYIKGDHFPIGGRGGNNIEAYTKHTLQIDIPTSVYIFSDGYQDQFGGGYGKKFMIKRLRKMFFDNHKKSLKDQKEIMASTLKSWSDDEKQVDDILIIGFKIE